MKVIKQGEVIFRDGKIKEIKDFICEGGNPIELAKWVEQHYIFQNEKEEKN